MKWIVAAAAVVFVLAVLLLIFTGFADVPCQDGVWDEARETCVPY